MPNDPIGFIDNQRPDIQGSGVDEKVKVSNDDTTASILQDKIIAGTGITLSIINDGANEQLQITAQAGAGSDDEEINVPFDYTSSSPVFIATVSPEGIVSGAKVYIETPFDGTADLQLGVPGNTDILMQSDEIDETASATYEVSPSLALNNGDVISLYMNLSGVTQGSGQVTINITR